MHKDIPIFSIDFTDESIWNNISIVDFPAIEKDFIKLSKQSEIKFKINEEKRDIMGPVIIKDQLIYRNDEKGEYYIKFSADTIKRMAIQFFKRDTQNNGNVMHEIDVPGVTFYQSFIKDGQRGLSPAGFEDVADGSWFVTAHVENEDVWRLIQEGELRGFSIDCVAGLREVKQRKEIDEIDSIEDLLEYIKTNK